MHRGLVEKLSCPECRSNEHPLLHVEKGEGDYIYEGQLNCPGCGASYSVEKGIPNLLPSILREASPSGVIPDDIAQKRRQIAHFNSIGTTELEITRPHGCGRVYDFLLSTKFEIVLHLLGRSLENQSILTVCCGSGMDAEFLVGEGANVVGVDISCGALLGAQERARRYGLNYDLVVGDAENLPFQDDAFDLTTVHDGLHHLPSPKLGFLEMARVASYGVLLTEPARSFVTALAIRMGISQAIEESGNIVRRFSKAELIDFCDLAGLKRPKMSRYAMFYRQEPLQLFQLFEGDLTFLGFDLSYRFFNFFIGRFGNKVALTAEC